MGGSDFFVCFDPSKNQEELQLKSSMRLEDRRRLLRESMSELVECLPKGQKSAVLNVLAFFHEDGTVLVKRRDPESEIADCVGAIVGQWSTDKGGAHGYVTLPLLLSRD